MAFGQRQSGVPGRVVARAVGRAVWIVRLSVVLAFALAAFLCRQLPFSAGQEKPQRGTAGQTPAIVIDDSPLKAFPNTVVTYYDVPGTVTADIVAYMKAHGPVDPNDHTVGAARTHWEIHWRWRQGAAACDKDHVEVTFKGGVLLPRLVDAAEMRAEDAQAWQRYYGALVEHEAGHLSHAYQHIGNVAAAIRSATCANAPEAARIATQALADYDAAYDRETEHGYLQGARHP